MNHHSGSHLEHTAITRAGFGSSSAIVHSDTESGPHVDMRAAMPASGLRDPGVGLRDHMKQYGRKVLTYYDLQKLDKNKIGLRMNAEYESLLTQRWILRPERGFQMLNSVCACDTKYDGSLPVLALAANNGSAMPRIIGEHPLKKQPLPSG